MRVVDRRRCRARRSSSAAQGPPFAAGARVRRRQGGLRRPRRRARPRSHRSSTFDHRGHGESDTPDDVGGVLARPARRRHARGRRRGRARAVPAARALDGRDGRPPRSCSPTRSGSTRSCSWTRRPGRCRGSTRSWSRSAAADRARATGMDVLKRAARRGRHARARPPYQRVLGRAARLRGVRATASGRALARCMWAAMAREIARPARPARRAGRGRVPDARDRRRAGRAVPRRLATRWPTTIPGAELVVIPTPVTRRSSRTRPCGSTRSTGSSRATRAAAAA